MKKTKQSSVIISTLYERATSVVFLTLTAVAEDDHLPSEILAEIVPSVFKKSQL